MGGGGLTYLPKGEQYNIYPSDTVVAAWCWPASSDHGDIAEIDFDGPIVSGDLVQIFRIPINGSVWIVQVDGAATQKIVGDTVYLYGPALYYKV